MREVSVTATVGHGNEIHNHDLEYRSTLEHVHKCEDGITEFIPYVDYRTRINALLKPYIDEYNAKVDERYQKAWERYNAGEIRSRPKKKDYQKMGYDYYNDHLNDVYYDQHAGLTKPLPLWREIIIGLGDQNDKESGIITREEAERIFRQFVLRWEERFPNLKLLGATMHTDERGFYHMHVDYKPLVAMEQAKGLQVSVSHEEAFKAMGIEPEQALINGRDKAPLRFNGFRNACYQILGEEMRKEGIYHLEGATQKKHPGKDSSTREDLDSFKARKDTIWKETQDKSRELQHQMNIVRDIIDHGEPTVESLQDLLKANDELSATLNEVENAPLTISRKEHRISFTLFDQLKTMTGNVVQLFAELSLAVKTLWDKISGIVRENEDLRRENSEIHSENEELKTENDILMEAYNELLDENQELKLKLGKRRSLDDTISISEQFKNDKIREQQK